MSGDGDQDEMVFGEVRFREPRRLRRPDRDRRFACVAYEVPRPDDLPIFLDLAAADAIERHALRDTSVELGGILLGLECLDDQTGEPFVLITRHLEAKHYENSQASFTYTHESWEEITRERERTHPDLDIVGWYHTHPDFGIFLSGHDQFIHRHFFDQPLQVAYVVDPIRQTRGFFRWRDGALEGVGGFYLVADRAERAALARFVNDLEGLPNPQSSGLGGGLSPRLEAELIAMLTRPQHAAPSAADRAQAAVAFGLIGAVLGALALSIILWINALNRKVEEQAGTLVAIRDGLARAARAREEDVDVARVRAKEVALDALLRNVRAGASPEAFAGQYAEAVRQRDEARRAARNQQTLNDALVVAAERRQAELAATQAKLLDREAEVKALRAEADRAKELKERLAALEDERGVTDLHRMYRWAWWTAVAGWAAGLLLALGLFAVLARGEPDDGGAVRPPHREADEAPPHSIT